MPPGFRRVPINITDDEYDAVTRAASDRELSVQNFIRQCVNVFLLVHGYDARCLEERHVGRPRTRTTAVSQEHV